jgi:UDP-3-O-[3-hydroxymyristoyl] glucosamine N-acyltransferase
MVACSATAQKIQVEAHLGNNVRLQASVMVSEKANFGNDIFLGQAVAY